MEVHEYGLDDQLPHVNHMLDHLRLEGDSPRPTSHPETVKGVMVVD